MTKGEFDTLVRTVWAYSDLPLPVVRVGLFLHVLAESRR